MASMAAEYCFIPAGTYEESTIPQHTHAGLALKHYVHFTSPIRRFADILTHRLLKDPHYHVDPRYIDNINATNKQIKKAGRDEKKLAIIYDLEDKGALVVKVYITEFDNIATSATSATSATHPPHSIRVWISQYDIIHTVELYKPEQGHYIRSEIDGTSLMIHNIQTDKKVTLHQYMSVQATIVPFPHQSTFNKKLSVTLDCLQCLFQV